MTVLSHSPGDILFPTTEKLEEKKRTARGSPPPWGGQTDNTSLHSQEEKFKGRKKNSGPCDILTSKAGATQGTSDAPHRTHVKLLVPTLLTLHRQGHKPHQPDTGQQQKGREVEDGRAKVRTEIDSNISSHLHPQKEAIDIALWGGT